MNTKRLLAAVVAIVATIGTSFTVINSLTETASGQNATTAGSNITGGSVTGGNATTAATAVGPMTAESGQSKEERYEEGWE
jgi:hypothetical protein